MDSLRRVLALVALTLASTAIAQEQTPVASESRDASLAYIGTSNFIVATIANRCKGSFHEGKSAKEFVLEWQERNAKYIVSAALYMDRRLSEALTIGGPEQRATIFEEVTSVSRANGTEAIQGLFQEGDKETSCDNVLALIGNGTFDVSPKLDMYDELEELSNWAQKQ